MLPRVAATVLLLRAADIPARYATGYLGDIGVPPSDTPMDFSAWFEVFLGDRWYTFDARHNRRRARAGSTSGGEPPSTFRTKLLFTMIVRLAASVLPGAGWILISEPPQQRTAAVCC